MKRKQRGARIPETFTAPHTAGPPPRCQACDDRVKLIREQPEQIPIDQLGRALAWVDSNPTPGTMVRADADGVEVWACPYHTSLERQIVKRTRRRGRIIDTVRWKVVPRA